MRRARDTFTAAAFAALLAPALAACAAAPRFKDQPIVWRVDDARDIPEPDEEEYLRLQYFGDIFAMRRLERLMELRDLEPARNTNALDEVPDSTWFTNRIGRADVAPAAIERGLSAPPELPLRVTAAKVGGGNPGFIVKDATARKFLIKFDRIENPEMQTAAGVVVGRLFWAIGYNVPSDHVFVFRRDQVSIDPKATYKDDLKDKHPFTARELDAVLESSPRRPDGAYRAMASEILAGAAKGGWLPEGVRADDPNDRIPHEHRRELRGLRVFSAWLGHTDMKQDNSLDMYVEEGGRRFLRHYLLDFGEALGGHAGEKGRDEDGFEHYIDWENQGRALVSLGLWKRPWEDRRKAPWLSIGAFSADDFDPRLWREAYPYFPFFEMDPADAYWAAKIAMRFERRHIEAAVAAGALTEPGADAYLVDALMRRRDKLGAVYVEAVTPLDELRIRRGALCVTDLGVRYRLAQSGMIERLGDRDEVLERITVAPDGTACLAIPDTEAYAVYRLRTRRGRDIRPPMQVHFKGGARARILGVIRVEP